MTNRRVLLATASAVLAQMLLPRAQAANSTVFQHDLPDVNLSGWAVTAVEVNYAPGASSAAHRHPGITIVYVLEGEIRGRI
jgi:quercetin dioxygenase-like cupin family protein